MSLKELRQMQDRTDTIPTPAAGRSRGGARSQRQEAPALLRVLRLTSAFLCAASPWAAGQGVEFQTNNAAAVATQRLKIEANADTANAYFMNARLGIGTAAPGSLLHVTGGLAGDG